MRELHARQDGRAMTDLDQHIENCETCGDGEGVCMQGYLMAVNEPSDSSTNSTR
jgi:hypothetical protein